MTAAISLVLWCTFTACHTSPPMLHACATVFLCCTKSVLSSGACLPFSHATPFLLAQELVCQERPLRGHLRAPRVPDECSEAVRALMEACIEAEAPALRPSAFEVFVRLANRWVTGSGCFVCAGDLIFSTRAAHSIDCKSTWPLQGHGDALESSVTLLHMFLWSLMWMST